jgi:hypothetical protein
MHFLGARRGHLEDGVLYKPWAAVKVKVVDRKTVRVFTADGELPFMVLKMGTPLLRLPDDVRVLGQDDRIIKPSRGFYITLETFDPYHAVVDGTGEP